MTPEEAEEIARANLPISVTVVPFYTDPDEDENPEFDVIIRRPMR